MLDFSRTRGGDRKSQGEEHRHFEYRYAVRCTMEKEPEITRGATSQYFVRCKHPFLYLRPTTNCGRALYSIELPVHYSQPQRTTKVPSSTKMSFSERMAWLGRMPGHYKILFGSQILITLFAINMRYKLVERQNERNDARLSKLEEACRG